MFFIVVYEYYPNTRLYFIVINTDSIKKKYDIYLTGVVNILYNNNTKDDVKNINVDPSDIILFTLNSEKVDQLTGDVPIFSPTLTTVELLSNGKLNTRSTSDKVYKGITASTDFNQIIVTPISSQINVNNITATISLRIENVG